MNDQHRMKMGLENWIVGAIMLVCYLLLRYLAPGLGTRTMFLIVILVGIAGSAVLVVIKSKKQQKEEDEKLPPI